MLPSSFVMALKLSISSRTSPAVPEESTLALKSPLATVLVAKISCCSGRRTIRLRIADRKKPMRILRTSVRNVMVIVACFRSGTMFNTWKAYIKRNVRNPESSMTDVTKKTAAPIKVLERLIPFSFFIFARAPF